MTADPSHRSVASNRDYAIGLARAFAGALIFAFPLVMTMEMWWIGFSITPARLLVFLLLGLGILVGLAYYSGFEPADRVSDAVLDGFTAYGVGFLGLGLLLWLLGVGTEDMGWRGWIGMIAVQAIPAGMGAGAARKQFGGGESRGRDDRAGYPAQLFLMVAGALFTAFNVAPTEEMILITYQMSAAQVLGLAALSLLLLHLLVYTVGFAGQEQWPEGVGFWPVFLHYTVVGYALALLVSVWALWTFGRTDGAALPLVAMMAVVLGFPAALGAAIARLVV
ncbi:TIGR02587 family membrane protein [Pseudoroseomonas ludipueritiae]|uniref:TIGR02587 family membrane protein n=1 Tax=Pseudoroseomonas ludipueritiae TaxID=198093 RepID=A0ABR7R6A7_9PROT|nr:TIGR02587 family membrane protein [Pseudoroseomonas ludipueritiae]MBC9177107.1 TIGR02587 family membrane protein [Pseudoroseomonas ludipueritiae]